MGKAGRWLRSILTGKKPDGGVRGERKALPLPGGPTTPREKKRWSFRRPSSAAQGKPAVAAAPPPPLSQEQKPPSQSVSGREGDERAVEVAVAAADADAAVVAACLNEAEEERDVLLARWLVEEAAAARIQATFRGYLARKALCALRGLVKLQALVRGQLVRRQANATLRRMQALVAAAQSRLRAQQRARADHHHDLPLPAAAAAQRRSPQHPRRRNSASYEMDPSGDEHVKVGEMDVEDPPRRGRSSCSAALAGDRRLAADNHHHYYHQHQYPQCSPAPSSAALTDLSPRTYSGHLDYEDSGAAPYEYDDDADPGLGVPSYMANTESSRAKARSQSAPRQRTADSALERQPSYRRRGTPVGRKTMQRSSSHIGVPAACGYQFQYPAWAAGVRLDRSSASLVGSECGSSSSALTAAAGYSRSLVGFDVQRGHY